jgi:hypothetical protein
MKTNPGSSIVRSSVIMVLLLMAAILMACSALAVTPIINRVYVQEPDNFYSSFASNNVVNIVVNASSNATAVIANFSGVGTIDCGAGSNQIALAFGSGLWTGACDVGVEAATHFFSGGPVAIVATDGENVTAPDLTQLIILYNMTTFPDTSCMHFGQYATNFSQQLNFSKVNFVIDSLVNLSCMMQTNLPGLGAPAWTGEFTRLAMLNFSSVNLTSQATALLISNVGAYLNVSITPPGSFGNSRLYLNSTYLASLNTTSVITLYHLPFASQPSIVADADAAGAASVSWAQGTGEGTLTFTVTHFSGYDFADNTAPIITVRSPAAAAQSPILVNVSINGTGTQLTSVVLNVSGLLYNYTYGGTNTANCAAVATGNEMFLCTVPSVNLSSGTNSLVVTAVDFGGTAGNTNTTVTAFVVDNSAPTTSITARTFPGAASYTANTWVKITNVSMNSSCVDTGLAGCAQTLYCTSGTSGGCAPSTPLTGLVAVAADGVTYFRYSSVDAAGNNETAQELIIKIDNTAPTTALTSRALPSGLAFTSNTWSGEANVTFNASCSDAGVSGCNLTYYCTGVACVPSTPFTGLANISAEGTSYFRYTSNDSLGNNETVQQVIVKLDRTAPTTTFTAVYYNTTNVTDYTNNTWVVGLNVTINVSCADGSGAGCNRTMYCSGVGCTPSTAFAGPVAVTTGGVSYFRFASLDNASNTEVAQELVINLAAPVTSITAMNLPANTSFANNTWTRANNVSINLSCASPNGGTCNSTLYCTGVACVPNATMGASIRIDSNGTTYFRYRSNNTLGINEPINTFVVKIDRTLPVVSILSPEGGSSSSTNAVVDFDATDENLDSCWWNQGGSNASISCTDTITSVWGSGSHTVIVYANDSAGNIGSSQVTFTKYTSGGGGGGGGSYSPWTLTMIVDDQQLLVGFTRAMAKNERFQFFIGSTSHYVAVTGIAGNLVTFEIASTPTSVTLALGETGKYDLDGDGYYDISVKLNSVTSGKADTTIKSIHEQITAPPATSTPVTSTPVETVVPPAQVTPVVCSPDWRCGEWSQCVASQRARVCVDSNSCNTLAGKPAESETCRVPISVPWLPIVIAVLVIAVLAFVTIFYLQKRYDKD